MCSFKPEAEPIPSEIGTLVVNTDKDGAEVRVAWEMHTLPGSQPEPPAGADTLAPTRLCLIMGFAAGKGCWYALLRQLRQLWATQERGPLMVLLMDNRGVGGSSSPLHKCDYTTVTYAADVLRLWDHHGWATSHVCGFSMGGMIATKLAASAPQRVSSLTLLSVTAGGSQIIPRTWKAFKYALKAICGPKTPEHRADVDLKFHFAKRTLLRMVPTLGVSVREVLRAEYIATASRIGPQPEAGHNGQMHAVWTHSVTKADVANIRSGGFPVWFVHGRHDLIATPAFAEKLAERFNAPCLLVEGAHFTPRECSKSVALMLMPLLLGSGHTATEALGSHVQEWYQNSLDGLALRLDLHVSAAGHVEATVVVPPKDAVAAAALAVGEGTSPSPTSEREMQVRLL